MKRRFKKKTEKKARRKGRRGRFLLLLILVGLSGWIVYLFRQELSDTLKPFLKKEIERREMRWVTLYFSDEEGEYLVGEKREIPKTGKIEEEARETLRELIKGPRRKLIATIPPKTKLLRLKMDPNGVAKVDFDQTLSKDHPGGSSAELVTIYSIVNSLTLNFPEIKQVRILMEGKAVESIAGHISLKQPVSSDPKMVKKGGKT